MSLVKVEERKVLFEGLANDLKDIYDWSSDSAILKPPTCERLVDFFVQTREVIANLHEAVLDLNERVKQLEALP